MCIDSSALNTNNMPDGFSLPRIAGLLDRLGKARFYSIIDLASAYHLAIIATRDTIKAVYLAYKGFYE